MDDLVDAVLLFANSKSHQHYTIKDLSTFIILPSKYNKLKVFRESGKAVGLITWIWLTPSRAEQFLLGKADLTKEEYKKEKTSGLELWGLDFISPYGKATKILCEFRRDFLKKYGESNINFRRLTSPTVRHERRIK